MGRNFFSHHCMHIYHRFIPYPYLLPSLPHLHTHTAAPFPHHCHHICIHMHTLALDALTLFLLLAGWQRTTRTAITWATKSRNSCAHPLTFLFLSLCVHLALWVSVVFVLVELYRLELTMIQIRTNECQLDMTLNHLHSFLFEWWGPKSRIFFLSLVHTFHYTV